MKDKNIYTVDYFIEKFEAIPDEDFGAGSMSAHCAYWHCDYTYSYRGQIATALTEIFDRAFGIEPDCNGNKEYFVYEINDGFTPRYQQPTAKQRMLAALRDIKQMQAPQEPKQEKEYIYCFSEKHESIEPLLEKEIQLS